VPVEEAEADEIQINKSPLGSAPTLSPSFLLALAIFEPNLFPYKYSNLLKPSHSSYLSAYEDGTECSETSAFKIQRTGNYPEESIQHSEQGVSLKSRIIKYYLVHNYQYTPISTD
jgi:hypothetical protein